MPEDTNTTESYGKRKGVVTMSYDMLERQIRMLPEECLEDVSHYIEFVIFKYQQNKNSDPVHDMSDFFGVMKRLPDGLKAQKELRDEWN